MNRTCRRRHATMMTASHPVAVVYAVTIPGLTLSVMAAFAVLADGPVKVAAVGVVGASATAAVALRTLHAHSDGDDVQDAARRQSDGPHYQPKRRR